MLPKTETRYYDYEINGKTIEFRAWKTKDEKEYLIMQASKDEMSDQDIFEILVKPCLKDPNISLTEGEKQLVMLEIRKRSFGESVDVQFLCGSCKKYNETKLNINEIVKYKPFKLEAITKDGITVNFKDTINIKLLNGFEGTKLNYQRFLLHIASLTIDNQVYKDFNLEELGEYFDNIDAETFDYFFAELQEQMEQVTYGGKVKCMFCNVEQDIGLGDLPNLFPW
jgi:hypothetical protein